LINCVVFCNFGDNFWVENNLDILMTFGIFQHFTVIDSNLLPKSRQLKLKPLENSWGLNVNVVPNNETEFHHASFEHAEALNKVLKGLTCKCDFVWIFDTDLFISQFAADFLIDQTDLYDAIFMQDPQHQLFSHPCLSIIRMSITKEINFLPSELNLINQSQTKKKLIDTGRTVAANLAQKGKKVAIVRWNSESRFRSRSPFPSRYPDFYLEGEIVHFRSMSFVAREDAKGRFKVADHVRYYFPRIFVVRMNPPRSTKIHSIFLNYEAYKSLFYLKTFCRKASRRTKLPVDLIN
jgi:hypothetical protein